MPRLATPRRDARGQLTVELVGWALGLACSHGAKAQDGQQNVPFHHQSESSTEEVLLNAHVCMSDRAGGGRVGEGRSISGIAGHVRHWLAWPVPAVPALLRVLDAQKQPRPRPRNYTRRVRRLTEAEIGLEEISGSERVGPVGVGRFSQSGFPSYGLSGTGDIKAETVYDLAYHPAFRSKVTRSRPRKLVEAYLTVKGGGKSWRQAGTIRRNRYPASPATSRSAHPPHGFRCAGL